MILSVSYICVEPLAYEYLGLQFRSLGTGLVLSHFQSDHFFSRPLLVDRDLGLVGLRLVVLVVHDDDLGLGLFEYDLFARLCGFRARQSLH